MDEGSRLSMPRIIIYDTVACPIEDIASAYAHPGYRSLLLPGGSGLNAKKAYVVVIGAGRPTGSIF